MEINKILRYKKHIQTIFCPLIDLKIKNLQYGLNTAASNNLIISLTSYGERIKELKYTLYSLFTQRFKPDKIILWLDNKYNTAEIHSLFQKFINNGLEIKFTVDIGSYTKLIPALKEFPDSIIVTADDDIFYPSDWLEKLYNSYCSDKSCIHCHRAHKIIIRNNEILPYEQWEKQINSQESAAYTYFLTGVGGVLYPPHVFSNEIFEEAVFKKLAPHADDIWFWAMAVLNSTKIKIVKNNINTLTTTNILRLLNFYKDKTLYFYNKTGGNDKQLNNILNRYPIIKQRLIEEGKIKLIFNITSLHSWNKKNGHRAGVFQAAQNILDEFTKDSCFSIAFYSNYKYFYFIKDFLKSNFNKYILIDERPAYKIIAGKIIYYSDKVSSKLMYLFIYMFRVLESLFPYNHKLKNTLDTYDVYFSPFEGVEKEFLDSNIKKYQFIHDVIPLLESKKLPPYHWANSVYRNIINDVYYFTNSEYTKNDFLKIFNYINTQNVKTAYLGCTRKPLNKTNIYKKYNISEDKKYILSLCSLGKRKNLKFAIDNFITFINQNHINDTVMVIAGAVWSNYKKELKNLDSNKNIIFTGYIDDEDLPNLYSNAFAFIYPSLYEGFGLPALEAMIYGCPVIASNRTSLPEICGNSALLINPENNEDILKAFKLIFSNPNIRQELILKASDKALLFTWSKTFNIIRQEILQHVQKQN